MLDIAHFGERRVTRRPRRPLAKIALAAVALCVWGLSLAYAVREPPYSALHKERLQWLDRSRAAIARREDALTFARVSTGGRLQIMLVNSYEGGEIEGMLLPDQYGSDPIELLARLGYEGVAALRGTPVRVREAGLARPFDANALQIAVGGNYPAHADETELDESFLFPKLSAPDRFDDDVTVRDGLLDYEIELGFVALSPIRAGDAPTNLGLVLASDYTDRATLLREARLTDIESGHGFPAAKSKPGFMPTGAFLVVPRDLTAFTRKLTMRLYVDGELRQVARPGDMVWNAEEILRRAHLAGDRLWNTPAGDARLPIQNGAIAARTIILSGTTDGVVFRPPSLRQIAIGVMEAMVPPWSSPQAALVEPTIREARADQRYLQPGSEVVMRADMLGVIRNSIVRGP